jgi:hypothetical protein
MIRSIEDESCAHFERRMLANYNLDEVKLRRLGYFFLVHSHIDTKLVALIVKSETVKLRQHRELSYDDLPSYRGSGRGGHSSYTCDMPGSGACLNPKSSGSPRKQTVRGIISFTSR